MALLSELGLPVDEGFFGLGARRAYLPRRFRAFSITFYSGAGVATMFNDGNFTVAPLHPPAGKKQ